MALSAKQRRQLEELQELEKQPAAPQVGRSVHVNVDLSDPDQVSMARRMGFLPSDEDDEPDEPDDGDDPDPEATPRRRGYFPDS